MRIDDYLDSIWTESYMTTAWTCSHTRRQQLRPYTLAGERRTILVEVWVLYDVTSSRMRSEYKKKRTQNSGKKASYVHFQSSKTFRTHVWPIGHILERLNEDGPSQSTPSRASTSTIIRFQRPQNVRHRTSDRSSLSQLTTYRSLTNDGSNSPRTRPTVPTPDRPVRCRDPRSVDIDAH